ncbi:MAG TPA: AMP-binding protein [Gemmataceae bacterium]|jgi:phenylacetate-CoA ligase|nr:AMP-binding protein [Gemmataceae bacterium]
MPASLAPDRLPRPALERLQTERLQTLQSIVLPANRFYANKFAVANVQPNRLQSLDDLRAWPLTTKAELLADQETHPPYGSNHTYEAQHYSRIHQTSGTSGKPLYWLDTPESWQSCLDIWKNLFRVAGIGPGDRLYFAFSFGPFLGFWTAFEAAGQLGLFCQAGGGLSTVARLRQIIEHRATVVLCTPTYALHLAQAAKIQGIDLASSAVRIVLVAGEPGGSIPETRGLIERGFGARVVDHCGMTEVGPTAIECLESPASLHIIETDYVAEILNSDDLQPTPPGQLGELILTTLSRLGSPLLRYRTGDLVRAAREPCPCGRSLLRLEGGILGRVDDMIHLRGNNFYPGAVEAILRRFENVVEYRITVDETAPLTALRIEVEPAAGVDGKGLAETVSQALRDELLFRVDVAPVPGGSLPRFEMKARRLVHKR